LLRVHTVGAVVQGRQKGGYDASAPLRPSAEWALKSDAETADRAIVPPSPLPSPLSSAGTPLEIGAQPLLPELPQSGLLLGLSVGVVGLVVLAAHLLMALQ